MEELRRIRELRGISQTGLGRTTGVDASTINQLEMGRRAPSLHTLVILADALHCEVRDFFPPGYTAPGAPRAARGRKAVAV
jgi:transcriptional regulator with XRE-family HTH domain